MKKTPPRSLCCLPLLGLALLLLGLGGHADTAPPKEGAKARLRRPAALAVAGEFDAGRRLADLAATPDGRRLLAVDEEGGELIVLERKDSALKVAGRLRVAPHPVS